LEICQKPDKVLFYMDLILLGTHRANSAYQNWYSVKNMSEGIVRKTCSAHLRKTMEIVNMYKQKFLTAAVATTLLAGAGLSQAQEKDDMDVASGDGFEISGNVALTSDYRFRGISQSDE